MRSSRALPWSAIAAVAALAIAAGFVRDFSGDFHWHVVLGEHLLDTGSLYTHDLHSITARGEPMFNTSWLGDAVYAASFRAGGYLGAYALRALALLAMCLLLQREAVRRGVSLLTASALVVYLLAHSLFVFYLRPETLAFALLAGVLAALGAHERTDRRRYLGFAVAAILLWANIHGSVGIGVMVIGAYCAQRLVEALRSRPTAPDWRAVAGFAAVPALAFALACANPHGIWLPLAFTRVQALHTATVAEYLPVTLSNMGPLLQLAAIAVVASTAAALALARRTSPWHLLALAVLAVFAHRYQRFVTYGLIVAVPLVAANLAIVRATLEARGALAPWRRLGALATAAAALLALGVLFVDRKLHREIGTDLDETAEVFPIAACDFLRAHTAPAPLFNSYDFGSYLMFCLGPDYPLFIDQRAQSQYSEAFYRRYRDAARDPEATRALADEYGAAWAIVGRDPFAAALAADRASWALLYFDDKASVYARTSHPRTAPTIAAHGFRLLSPDHLPALTDLPPHLHADAIAELERQRQRCARCYRTELVAAAVATATGDDRAYDDALTRLLERPETAQVAFLGARHAIARGDLAAAALLFDRFAALGGDPIIGVVYRTRALAAAGRHDEARQLLDRAAADPRLAPIAERLRRELTPDDGSAP